VARATLRPPQRRTESFLAAVRETDPFYVTVAVMAVCALMLTAGYVLKSCHFPHSGNVPTLCYSDIKLFYRYRDIGSMPLPYVHGGLRGFNEYPVLTGLFAWSTARLAANPAQYLMVSAALLGTVALGVAYVLDRITGWRALLWAGAPAIALYAFHNWDVLAVAASVLGIWCWLRGHPTWAAVCFGVGGALKLYPVLFVVPLTLDQLSCRGRGKAVTILAIGLGTAAAINLPFMIMNFGGWFGTYRFHSSRPPNIDSLWGVVLNARRWDVTRLNLLSTGLMLITFLTVLAAGQIRSRRDGSYPFVQVCGALLAGFLLWNKVQSPQYTLWILPFLVLLRVRLVWWLLYAALDFLVYVSVLYLGPKSFDLARPYLRLSVYGRAALLAALIALFLRADEAAAVPERVPP
jgi:uncharacterized membrane protein